MPRRKLRPYICRQKDDHSAMLVFAYSAQEARKMSFGYGWDMGDEWIRWTATWIRDLPEHLWAFCAGEPCVEDAPPICQHCECWGGHPKPHGCCSFCYDEDDWQGVDS